MTERVSIIREPDDTLAVSRVSLGRAPGGLGFYIVFRGEPAAAVELLEKSLEIARAALPAGRYSDRRGRPQG
jgi:hypothetical protein